MMKYSHRIFYYFLKDDVLFGRILEYIRHNPAGIDEIALMFDETCSAYQPPKKIEEESRICRKRIQQLRDAGVRSVGINMLATLGHLGEAWSWNEAPPFQTAVSPSGKLSFGFLCPRNEAAQEYIRSKYRAAIAAEPDFLWVDDDFRPNDVEKPCFCDRCIQQFNRLTGSRYYRDSLVKALRNPANETLIRQWFSYNLDSFKTIASLIRQEVEKSDRRIKIGLMTSPVYAYQSVFFDVNALISSLGAEMTRPGDFFYQDDNFELLTRKICSIAFQNAMADHIRDRMYELEDFPACVPQKSVRTHITESTLAIMGGCDGIITNSMPPCKGTAPIYKALEKQRGCHEIIAERMRQTKLSGVRAAFSKEIGLHLTTVFPSRPEGFVTSTRSLLLSESALLLSGFAPFADPMYNDAWITILSGEMAKALSDREITEMFSRSVLLDGDAAAILCERGCSHLIGCVPGEKYDNGVAEFYTSHSLNGEAALERRDTRMTFHHACNTMSLIPSDGAEPLTDMVSITGEKLGVASIAFENELGGRCVVMGYDPWRYPNMWHREHQLHNIFEWLWNGHEPYRGIKAPRIFQLFRESPDKEKFILMLTNMWEDNSGEILIRFSRQYAGVIRSYRGKGKMEPLPEEDTWTENNRTCIRLPSMESHTFVVIMNDPA